MPPSALINAVTTAAVAELSNPRFENFAQMEDPDLISMDMNVQFNGVTGQRFRATRHSRRSPQRFGRGSTF